MIEKIIEFGDKLENHSKDSEAFISKAREYLNSLNINLNLEQFNIELSLWLLNNSLPDQVNVYNVFGQPPVTIYRGDTFVIDIYFWMHADTSLHSHSFCGAFKVLYGKSLHEEFEIAPTKTYSDDVVLNKLQRNQSNILRPGDTQTILRGNTFNHRVLHLSSPTVSLCIRTTGDEATPQWHYFDNGLSILKRELNQSVLKKMFYGDYLYQVNPKNVELYLKSFINSLSASELINLFEKLTVDLMGLSEGFQEILYNEMMNKLNQYPWFELYQKFCDESQNYNPFDSHDELSKLQTHMKYFKYNNEESSRLEKLLSL